MLPDVKSELVEELRRMLLDGATPSRLLRRLLDDPSSKDWHPVNMLAHYFAASFGDQIYQMTILGDVDFSDLRYHHLNSDVLHKILQGLNDWRGSIERADCWCDGAELTDLAVQMQEFDGSKDPYLAESWGRLDSRAQSYIRQQMSLCQVAYEKVRILQLLAERLQQKLFHLEQQVEGEHRGQ